METVESNVAGNARLRELEAVYRAEYVGMVRLAFTLISNNAEAEEVVQDAFVDVFRRFDTISEPGAYLRRAVINRCHSLLRHRRVRSRHEFELPSHLSPSAGELWDVLALLPDYQRLTIVLRFYGGYRATEIAALIDQPPATVRSHLRRGLARLRKELA